MNRKFGLSAVTLAVAFGVSVIAIERPTQEYQELMKSNASIVDLVGSNNALGRDTNVDVGRFTGDPAIRQHLKDKDFDAIVGDAATLKANFTKLEAFWTERNVEDATNWSKDGLKLIAELETAAKAKDNAGVVKTQAALAQTCRDCHLAHRVVMLTERAFSIR